MWFFKPVFGLVFAALVYASPPLLSESTHTSCRTPHSKYLSKVSEQFHTDQIIPDLIERITPAARIHVRYGTKIVKLGTYFTTLQTLNKPVVQFSAEEGWDPATTKYTYFLIDPDVPEDGSPAQVSFAHWMVSHSQPSCITSQSPEEVIAYQSPTPASTTQHRYTFLLYREPEGYEPANDPLLQIRSPFDINDYVQDHGLVLVGGNFFKESITNGQNGKI